MSSRVLLALAGAGLLLAACGTTTQDRALSGGAIGAGVAGVAGALTGALWRERCWAARAVRRRALSPTRTRSISANPYGSKFANSPQKMRSYAPKGTTGCHKSDMLYRHPSLNVE